MGYPEKLLKGLANKEYVIDGCVVDSAFSSSAFKDSLRHESFEESSVNWLDDEGAIEEALNKKKDKDGSIQFKAGIAVINRRKLHYVLNAHIIEGRFKYERDPTEENKYHGNLLLKKGLEKQLRRLIINGICHSINKGDIIPPLTSNG